MSRFADIPRVWLPLSTVTTSFSLLAYVTTQPALQQGANDPQIQMAEDAAAALNGGATTGEIVTEARVDISQSLAPFVAVYDTTGKPVASSGLLDGQMPEYPIGALVASKQSSENRVTWQPKADTRVASVAVPYAKGYVVAGRNLREIEKREQKVAQLSLGAWVATLLAVFAMAVFTTS
jgi:hypothetical protein